MSREEKMDHPERGDSWLWAGMDPRSKAIIQWQTGRRSAAAARAFAGGLASRIVGRVQITSDKLDKYEPAIREAFGPRADYAQEEKKFQTIRMDGHEWIKNRVNTLVGMERTVVYGNPNLKTSTVCHMERYFLTVRQGNKRCARKTLAYSKLWGNHAAAASVHIFLYNMVRGHESLKKLTPAQVLGVAEHRWSLKDVVEMVDAYLKGKEEREFEAAFSTFNVQPTAKRVWEPQKPRLPWYLDPESGGPPQAN